MSFRTVHHEGGTSIYFDGKNFVRSEYGESESFKILGTEDEVLDCIRELYDWESRRDSFPHRPPELEVWGFIRQLLLQRKKHEGIPVHEQNAIGVPICRIDSCRFRVVSHAAASSGQIRSQLTRMEFALLP